MKTVINKTRKPIRVPLPRGKALHLGPGKEGQIRDEAAEREAIKKLAETGTIEIVESREHHAAGAMGASPSHEVTHGRAKSPFRQNKGDR